MAYSYSYQSLENNPTDSSKARDIDDYMRRVAKGIGERLENMFYGFDGTETDEGVKRLEFVDQGSDPTTNRTLYTKSGEIYLKDGSGNVVQFSSSGYIPLSSTRIANNTYIIARNAADTGNLSLIKLNASDEAEIAQALQLPNGTSVNEFSTDGTFGGNSDNAVPTEKAVKTYHDNNPSTASVDNTTIEYNASNNLQVVANGIGQSQIGSSAVGQGELKTSTGTVSKINSGQSRGNTPYYHSWIAYQSSSESYSTNIGYKVDDTSDFSSGQVLEGNTTLPGGLYGFYPQVKGYSDMTTDEIRFYAKQKYVTASGPDHWIFLLRDKKTGEITGGYQAPDHPEYGQGETDIRKLLDAKDNEEIILVDNEILKEIKDKQTTNRDILTIIHEEYEINDKSKPKYKTREIIEIDEFGDKKGKTIKKMKTPNWARIKITKDEIELKKRQIKKDWLDKHNIKYKKLKRI